MDDNPVGSRQVPPKLDSGQRDERSFVVIKYVYEIDYPPGEKRKYLEWVRSIADTLQAPGELKRLASYDNAFSAAPHQHPRQGHDGAGRLQQGVRRGGHLRAPGSADRASPSRRRRRPARRGTW